MGVEWYKTNPISIHKALTGLDRALEQCVRGSEISIHKALTGLDNAGSM